MTWYIALPLLIVALLSILDIHLKRRAHDRKLDLARRGLYRGGTLDDEVRP